MPDRQDIHQAAGSAKQAAGDAERHASRLERSRTMRTLARAGHVANGLVHLALSGIAVAVAVGAGGGSADQSGAMQSIASTPLGAVVVWAVAIAMLALAVFAVLEGVAERARDGAKALAKGVGKAIAYGAIGVTAITTATGGGGGGGGDSQAQSLTGTLMAQPFGQVLVGLIGLGIAAIGVAFIVQGVRRTFERHISPPASARRAARILGTVGYVAKGVAIVLVGVLFVAAAVTHDASQAGGLDAGLKSLQELPFGPVVLLAVALGIGAYGIFAIARGIWTSKR
jgi:hypothetical protein